MNQNYFQRALSMLVLLMAILACVLPSQAAQPAPITNPINIETAVAGTAQAAEQLTQQANATTTLGPTGTPAATPKVSSVGTSLVTLADGSTQFIDYVAGMQMTFAPGWLVVRVGQDEYYEAWGRQEAANPHFQEIFTTMQDLDPKVFRLDALDLRPEHMPDGDIVRVEAVFGEGNTKTLNQVKKDETTNHLPLTGYKLLASNFFETPQGMQALNIEFQWKYNGGTKTGYDKTIYFKVPGGNMAVSLIASLEQKESALPEFDQFIGNIVLFTP